MSENIGINLQAGLNVAQSTTNIKQQIQKVQDLLKPLNIKIDSGTLVKEFDKVSSSIKVATDGTSKIQKNIISIATEEGKLVQITQAYNKEINAMAISGIKIVNNLKAQANEVNKIAIAEKKRQQVVGDSARKMIAEEEKKRISSTTETQKRIELKILGSNQTISEQQKRMNSVNANNYEQVWLKALRRVEIEEAKLANQMGRMNDRSQTRVSTQNNASNLAQNTAINNASNSAYIQAQRDEQARLKARQEASDTARRMTATEEAQRVAATTNAQRRIEQSILGSNETIAQQQTRMNASQANGYRYEQMFLQASRERGVIETRNAGLETQQTNELKRQIALYQTANALQLRNLQAQYGSMSRTPAVQSQIRAVQSTVGNLSSTALDAQGFRTQSAAINSSISSIRTSLNETRAASYSLGNAMLGNVGKMMLWGVAATAVYAPFRAIKSGLTTLKELDILMVSIAKVTNLSAEAMDSLKNSSFEASSAFGRTAQDYLKSIGEFSRAGYEDKSADLAKISLLSQNVGELTAEQANSFLLATDAAYKYKGSQEELMKVLDGVNIIDNRFATSIQKVSEGITVAGSIASNASVGVNELSAAVGTMTAITQRSGNEAGRAFRSILMNIRQVKGETEDGEIIDDASLSKSAEALANVGIKVHEVRNGIEELRNPMDVLKDLSNIWGSLSTMKTSPIIDAIGGKYRGNQLVALVENFDMYEKMLTEYSNASGSAMAENEIRMGSWETKINQLKNTIGNFWNESVNTNLVKGFIDSLNYLISTFGNLQTILSVVGTILLAWKGTAILAFFQTLPLAIRTSIFSMELFREVSIASTMVASGQISALRGLIFSFQALGTAIKGIFMSNPLGWIAIGITTLVMAMDTYDQKQEKAIQKQKEAIDTYKQQQIEISSLIESYKQNALLAETNDNAKKQLLETEKKLKGIFGETAQGLNLQSGAIDKNIDQLNKLDIANQKSFISEQKANAEKAKNALNSSKEYSATSKTMNPFTSGTTFEGAIYKGTADEALKYYKNLREEINKDLHGPSLFNSSDTITQANQITEVIKQIEAEINGYKTAINTVDDAYKIVTQSSIEGLDKLDEKQKKVYEDTKGKLTFTNQDQYKKNLQDVADILSKWDGKNLDDVNNKLHNIDSSLPLIANNANASKDSIDKVSTSLKTLQETMSTSASAIADIQSALDSYADSGSFSLDTLIKLSKEHESLIPILGDEKKVHAELINIIEQEKEKSEQAYIAMINGSTQFYDANIDGIKNLVEGLGLQRDADLKGAKDLASAKLQVELGLIKKLATLWSSYYDTKTGAFTGEVEQIGSRQVVTGGSEHKSTYVTDEMNAQMVALARAEKIAKEKFDAIVLNTSGIDFSKIGMSASDEAKRKEAEKKAKEEIPENVTGPYAKEIREIAKQQGISATLLDALVKQESGFRKDIVSPSGAVGLTQLMPGTAQSLGVTNSYDVEQNLTGGAKYLKQQLDKFGGDISLALAAYNAGPGAVTKYGGIPPYAETQNYVKSVLGDYNARKSNSTAVNEIGDKKIEESAYKDTTEAILKEKKALEDLIKTKNDLTKKEIESAKSSQNYNLAITRTHELIASQSQQLSELNTNRDSINALKDIVMESSSSQFGDISKWFVGDNSEESISYVNDFNNSSAQTQKVMETTFQTVQKLRQAWVENKSSVDSLTESQQALQDSLLAINIESFNTSLSQTDYQLSLSQARMSLLSDTSSEYSEEIAKQTSLYEQKNQTMQSSLSYMNSQLTNDKLSTEAKANLTKQIDELTISLLNNQNAIKELLTSDISTKHDKIIEDINKSLDSYSTKLDEILSKSEERIQKYNDKLSNIDYDMSLLQESDYTDKEDLLNDAIDASSDKANRLASEFKRLSNTTVYSKEDAERLKQELQSLKDEMQSTNKQTIEYVRTLEQVQFAEITSEAKLAQDEIDRMTSRINDNRNLLEGGMLSGTSLSFDFSMPDGNTLDLSSITNDSLDNIEEIEIKVDDSLQNQLENAEEHYEEMMELINNFFEIMLNSNGDYNSDIENGTGLSLNNQYSEYGTFYSNLSSLIESSMKDASEIQKGYLQEMLDNVSDFNDDLDDATTPTTKSNSNSGSSGSSSNSSRGKGTLVDSNKDGTIDYKEYENGERVYYSYDSFAKGTSKDGAEGGLSQTSELGQELLVYPDGKVELTGDNGPEFRNLPKGTHVIPNSETKELLKNRSYASGTEGYEKLFEALANATVLSIDKVVRNYTSTIDKKANKNPDDYVIDSDENTSSTWIPMAKYNDDGKIIDFIEDMSVTQVDTILELVEKGYQFVDKDMVTLFTAGLTKAQSEATAVITRQSNEISDIISTGNQGYQEAIASVTGKISNFQSEYTAEDTRIGTMEKGGSSETEILEARGKLDYDVNENSFLWTDELLQAKEDSARETIANLTTYMEDNDLTEEAQTQAREAIQEQNDILTNSLIQRKQAVKSFFDYEQSLRDQSLQNITDSQDDIQFSKDMTDENDYSAQINLSEQLAEKEQERLTLLESQKEEVIKQRDELDEQGNRIYEIGSYEWNLLNTRAKDYGELIEDSTLKVKENGEELANLKIDAIIKPLEDDLEDLDLAGKLIDEDDLDGKFENASDKLETLIDKQKAIQDQIDNIDINNPTLTQGQKDALRESLEDQIGDVKVDVKVGKIEVANLAVESALKPINDAIDNVDISIKLLDEDDLDGQLSLAEQKLLGFEAKREVIRGKLDTAKTDNPEMSDGELTNYKAGLTEELSGVEVDIHDTRVNVSDLKLSSTLKPFNDKQDNLSTEISYNEELIKLYETQGGHEEEISALTKENLGYLAEKLASEQSELTALEELLATQKEGTAEWIKTNDAIDDVTSSILDTKSATAQTYKDIADDIIDAYKEAYKKQEEIALASIEKQKDAYDDLIDAKIKALDDANTTSDYNEELTDMQSDAQKTQNKINALSNDDSIEGKAKRLALEEQLAEEKLAISKKQRGRDRELQKESLEEQKTNNTAILDQQKVATTAYYDGLINDEQFYADRRAEIYAGNFTKIQGDFDGFNTYFKAQNKLTIDELGISWQGLLTLTEQVKTVGESLTALPVGVKVPDAVDTVVEDAVVPPITGTPKVEDAIVPDVPEVVEVDPIDPIDPIDTSTPIETPTDYSKSIKIGDKIFDTSDTSAENTSAMNSAIASGIMPQKYVDGKWIDAFETKNDPNSLHVDDTTGKIVNFNPEERQDIVDWTWDQIDKNGKQPSVEEYMAEFGLKRFDTGGSTGNSEGLAWLDKKEQVLSDVQTVSWKKLVDNLPSLTSIMDKIMANVNPLQNILSNLKIPDYSSMLNQMPQQSMEFNFDSLINVQGNIDKDALPSMKDIATFTINELNKTFNRKGILR